MKKEEVIRTYKFSDARLITLGLEKIAFMNRDREQFHSFGITIEMMSALEMSIHQFEDTTTDIEALSDQTEVFAAKEVKAEELRVAIRNIMARVERKYGKGSARYRKFGTHALSRFTDSELLVTAKRVVRVGNELLDDLSATGLTADMLSEVMVYYKEFYELMLDLQLKISNRDILQEDRVEQANALYATLVSFASTGRTIWETTDVAKYNDYILYDTVTGEAPGVTATYSE